MKNNDNVDILFVIKLLVSKWKLYFCMFTFGTVIATGLYLYMDTKNQMWKTAALISAPSFEGLHGYNKIKSLNKIKISFFDNPDNYAFYERKDIYNVYTSLLFNGEIIKEFKDKLELKHDINIISEQVQGGDWPKYKVSVISKEKSTEINVLNDFLQFVNDKSILIVFEKNNAIINSAKISDKLHMNKLSDDIENNINSDLSRARLGMPTKTYFTGIDSLSNAIKWLNIIKSKKLYGYLEPEYTKMHRKIDMYNRLDNFSEMNFLSYELKITNDPEKQKNSSVFNYIIAINALAFVLLSILLLFNELRVSLFKSTGRAQ